MCKNKIREAESLLLEIDATSTLLINQLKESTSYRERELLISASSEAMDACRRLATIIRRYAFKEGIEISPITEVYS